MIETIVEKISLCFLRSDVQCGQCKFMFVPMVVEESVKTTTPKQPKVKMTV